MVCIPCGQEVEDGQVAIFGLDRGDGLLVFGWTCCHRPVGDVAVILGSEACMNKWVSENPQYYEAIEKLLEEHKKTHS